MVKFLLAFSTKFAHKLFAHTELFLEETRRYICLPLYVVLVYKLTLNNDGEPGFPMDVQRPAHQ